MSDAGDPLLDISDLAVNYGALPVLRNVSLQVQQGEVVGVLGPNGHGKTTLLRTVSGLVKQGKGSIRFSGVDISAVAADRRRRLGVAHVPQGDLLFHDMSVEENMAAGAYYNWRNRQSQISEVLSLFPELRNRRSAQAATLSGGERRLLAIARAIMTPAKILLVDEPSIGLSPSAITRVYEILRLLRQNGGTIFLVEETLTRLAGFADRVYLIDHGQIVAETTPVSLAEDTRLGKIYLGEI